MTERELNGLLFLGGIALILCVIGVLLFGGLLHIERHLRRWLPVTLLPLLVLGLAVSSLTSGRVLTYAFESLESIGALTHGAGTWPLRLVTLTVLAVSLITITARLFTAPGANPPRGQQSLFIAFSAFFLSHAVLNSAFGERPEFIHNLLYAIFPFAAIYMSRDLPVTSFVRALKYALFAFMVASLGFALILPDLALQSNYRSGWVPGLTIRLWGLGSNPNSIGPLALLLLLLEWLQPERRLLSRVFVVLPSLAVLFLSQSKTAWAAAVLLVAVLLWYRFGKSPQGGIRIGYLFVMLTVGAIAVVMLWVSGRANSVSTLMAGQVGTDIATLTGRVQIWSVAIETWERNPLFGYGPLAWGPEHRYLIGLPFAFSAHNQFLESLSSSGLVGLVSLLVYLGFLGVAAYRAGLQTRGVSVAIYLVILARCVTETPLDPAVMFGGEMIAQLFLFRLVLQPNQSQAFPRIVEHRRVAAS